MNKNNKIVLLVSLLLLVYIVISSNIGVVRADDNSKPEDGVCGQAAKEYSATATDFDGNMCSKGNQDSFPSFPALGKSVNWTCKGTNGGNPSSTCTASRSKTPTTGGNPPPGPTEGKTKFGIKWGTFQMRDPRGQSLKAGGGLQGTVTGIGHGW